MRAKQALEILQVHRVTLNKYVREGKIRVTKMANNRYEYNDDIFAFVGKKKTESPSNKSDFLFQSIHTGSENSIERTDTENL